jgi:hypothetical protein
VRAPASARRGVVVRLSRARREGGPPSGVGQSAAEGVTGAANKPSDVEYRRCLQKCREEKRAHREGESDGWEEGTRRDDNDDPSPAGGTFGLFLLTPSLPPPSLSLQLPADASFEEAGAAVEEGHAFLPVTPPS